jgi:hypothetical protein
MPSKHKPPAPTKACPQCARVYEKRVNCTKSAWEKQKYCSQWCAAEAMRKAHK